MWRMMKTVMKPVVMKIAVADDGTQRQTRYPAHAVTAGAAASIGRAEADEKSGDRHEAGIAGHGLHKRCPGHRSVEERGSNETGDKGRRAAGIGAVIGRKQPAKNAADAGDAAVEQHQDYGGEADQRATNRRSKWCEFCDCHSNTKAPTAISTLLGTTSPSGLRRLLTTQGPTQNTDAAMGPVRLTPSRCRAMEPNRTRRSTLRACRARNATTPDRSRN